VPESLDCARAAWALVEQEYSQVGKGDRKTRRGKIYRGSFGKSRPKDPDKNKPKTTTKSSTSKK
jgi:30S ribosomal protein S31